MVKKIKNITLFIDDKIITDAKVSFSSRTMNITLPHYTVEGVLDSTGENKIFPLMSYGKDTLQGLEERAIMETNYRKQFKELAEEKNGK